MKWAKSLLVATLLIQPSCMPTWQAELQRQPAWLRWYSGQRLHSWAIANCIDTLPKSQQDSLVWQWLGKDQLAIKPEDIEKIKAAWRNAIAERH